MIWKRHSEIATALVEGVKIEIRYGNGLFARVRETPRPGDTILKVECVKVLSPDQTSRWDEAWDLLVVIYAIETGEYTLIKTKSQ